MALEIALRPLGHVERGDPKIIWTEAKGTTLYSLETLLQYFWVTMAPEGADGPAIMVRFGHQPRGAA